MKEADADMGGIDTATSGASADEASSEAAADDDAPKQFVDSIQKNVLFG